MFPRRGNFNQKVINTLAIKRGTDIAASKGRRPSPSHLSKPKAYLREGLINLTKIRPHKQSRSPSPSAIYNYSTNPFTMKAQFLVSLSILVLGAAAIAAKHPKDTEHCCCCDISRGAIACNLSIKKSDCVCAAVVCPADAPTVYDNE